jgi:hypothetical protein
VSSAITPARHSQGLAASNVAPPESTNRISLTIERSTSSCRPQASLRLPKDRVADDRVPLVASHYLNFAQALLMCRGLQRHHHPGRTSLVAKHGPDPALRSLERGCCEEGPCLSSVWRGSRLESACRTCPEMLHHGDCRFAKGLLGRRDSPFTMISSRASKGDCTDVFCAPPGARTKGELAAHQDESIRNQRHP